jgi:hypothetical protein
MFVPLVIIGTADDGPDGTLFLPETPNDAETVFGWKQTEYYTLQSDQASASTKYPIWGGLIDVYKKVGSRIYRDPLYMLRVQASGTYVTFGQPGASGSYIFSYVRVPNDDNIVLAMHTVLNQGADMPYLYRVPGTKANVIIGGLKLEAEYSGEKYNDIPVIVDNDTLTIVYTSDYAPPSGISYDIHQPANLLVDQINKDHYTNKHPLMAYSVFNPAIPSGTYATSGGANGTVNSWSVCNALDSMDLDSVGMIVIAGSPPSEVVNSALGFIESQGEYAGPACLIASAPWSLRGASAEDLEAFLNSLPFNSNKLFYVPGWGADIASPVNPAWIPLSYVFAGLWLANTSAPTNKSTSLYDISPIWSTDQLHSLGNKYCVFNKYIISNLSPWRSCPTNGENPLITKVKIDIANRIGSAFEYIIGEQGILPDRVYDITGEALEDLDNVRDIQYTCEIGTYYIIITVYVIVYGETQYIQMNLISRRPENA